MAAVYSERFFLVSADTNWIGFFVPVEKRAVIRSLVFLGNGTIATTFTLNIGSASVVIYPLPASSRMASIDTRIVAYGGEELLVNMSTNTGSMAVSGYLLDAGGARHNDPPRNYVADSPVTKPTQIGPSGHVPAS